MSSDNIELAKSYLKDALDALDMVEEKGGSAGGVSPLAPGLPITGAQCRGARGLLVITAAYLSSVSGVPAFTISRFETGAYIRDKEAPYHLRATLERLKIRFYENEAVGKG